METINPVAPFQTAYDYFNDALFSGFLPDVVITLQRTRNAKGYFSPKRFIEYAEAGKQAPALKDRQRTHELAMNPETFSGRTFKQILSTLVHEMVHVWQEEFGTPSKDYKYHNTEWADEMEKIGLIPSATGQPGGARTGRSMTHYIKELGRFDIQCDKLLRENDLTLQWEDIVGVLNQCLSRGSTGGAAGQKTNPGSEMGGHTAKPKHKRGKTKYTCKCTNPNKTLCAVYSKPGRSMFCNDCGTDMIEH